MSNRKRSKQEVTVKRFGKMADGMQEKINNQAASIGRLVKALTAAQDGLFNIQHEAKDVRAARKIAKETAAAINVALTPEEKTYAE